MRPILPDPAHRPEPSPEPGTAAQTSRTPPSPARIYLDHHATTPVDPRVAALMVGVMTEDFGNPNSAQHAWGQDAARVMLDAAVAVARLVGAQPDGVRFTSGASEALRLALAYACDRKGGAPLLVAASRVEHPALIDELRAGERDGRYRIVWMPVDGKGRVLMDTVRAALKAKVDLFCLQAANNEVGTIQPFGEAAALAQASGAEVLVDATQAAGRIPLSMAESGVDYLVLSGHKIYGPKGVGALVGPDLAEMPPPSRYAFHNATPNVPGIAGMGEACRLRLLEMAEDEVRIAALRDLMQARLQEALPALVVNGDQDARLSNNLHISIPGAQNDIVVANLRSEVAISTGAACMAGVDAPSHVLQAMGLEPWRLDSALRISLGRTTTAEDVRRAGTLLITVLEQVQTPIESAA